MFGKLELTYIKESIPAGQLIAQESKESAEETRWMAALCLDTPCDSETCIFAPQGYCLAPLIYGKAPVLNEDGCNLWNDGQP